MGPRVTVDAVCAVPFLQAFTVLFLLGTLSWYCRLGKRPPHINLHRAAAALHQSATVLACSPLLSQRTARSLHNELKTLASAAGSRVWASLHCTSRSYRVHTDLSLSSGGFFKLRVLLGGPQLFQELSCHLDQRGVSVFLYMYPTQAQNQQLLLGSPGSYWWETDILRLKCKARNSHYQVCVCMCACVTTWVFVCVFVHTSVHGFMYVHVCVYACVCVHMWIFIWIYAYASVCVCMSSTCICMCVCLYECGCDGCVCAGVYVFVCACVGVCVHAHVYICVCMHVCVYMHCEWEVCVCVCVMSRMTEFINYSWFIQFIS